MTNKQGGGKKTKIACLELADGASPESTFYVNCAFTPSLIYKILKDFLIKFSVALTKFEGEIDCW